MSFRTLGAIATAAVIVTAAAPASAQQFSDGYNFLEAVKKEDGTKINEILNEPGTRIIDTKDKRTGEGALHIVARSGNSVYLRFFLQRDANPNIQDQLGNSPLMVAVNAGNIEAIEILLKYKANINLRNNSGETPLIRAVQLRSLPLVQLLLANDADPDQSDVIAGMSARDYAKSDRRAPASIVRALEAAPKVKRANVSGPKL